MHLDTATLRTLATIYTVELHIRNHYTLNRKNRIKLSNDFFLDLSKQVEEERM